MKAKISKTKTHNRRGAKVNPAVLIEPSMGQLSFIDSLIQTAEVPEHEYRIYRDANIISEGQAEELITELLSKQRNPVLGGFNYQQGDILKMLKLLKDE